MTLKWKFFPAIQSRPADTCSFSLKMDESNQLPTEPHTSFRLASFGANGLGPRPTRILFRPRLYQAHVTKPRLNLHVPHSPADPGPRNTCPWPLGALAVLPLVIALRSRDHHGRHALLRHTADLTSPASDGAFRRLVACHFRSPNGATITSRRFLLDPDSAQAQHHRITVRVSDNGTP